MISFHRATKHVVSLPVRHFDIYRSSKQSNKQKMYRRVTFSSLGRRLQQRSIASSVCLQSERALPHFHADDQCNEALRTPKTVSIIGAPMTCTQL